MAIVDIFKENPLEEFLNPEEGFYADRSKMSVLNRMADMNRRRLLGDKTKKRNTFSGILLRIEAGTQVRMPKTISPTRVYEPGSFPFRRYAGKVNMPPILLAAKIYVPEIHSMLPVPLGKDSNHLIDLYPTFYAVNRAVISAKYGQIVRVRFGDLDNFEDPIYLGPEFGAQTVYGS
jgi:hypothetical protein